MMLCYTTMTYKQIAHEGERGNRILGNDKQEGDLLLLQTNMRKG